MGVLLALAAMVRYPNGTLALVPIVLGIGAFRRASAAGRGPVAGLVAGSAIVAAAAFVIGFLPQLFAWHAVYGKWIVDSYAGEEMHAWPVHGGRILFGTRNSLFLYSPLMLFAVVGLVRGALRGRESAVAGIVVLGAVTWTYGSWECYWLGNSYGMRAFVDSAFFLMLGLCEFLAMLPARRGARRIIHAGIVVLVAWNLFLALAVKHLVIPADQPLRWPENMAGGLADLGAGVRGDFRTLTRLGGKRMPLLTPKDSVLQEGEPGSSAGGGLPLPRP